MLICGNCGKELPDESRFCSRCGQPTAKKPETDHTEKSHGGKCGFFRTVILGVLTAALLTTGVLAFSSRKINLNRYVTVTASGENGQGEAEVQFDRERLQKDYGSRLRYKANEDTYAFLYKTPYDAFDSMIGLRADRTDGLFNGDVVTLTWVIRDGITDGAFNYGVKAEEIRYTVTGLTEPEEKPIEKPIEEKSESVPVAEELPEEEIQKYNPEMAAEIQFDYLYQVAREKGLMNCYDSVFTENANTALNLTVPMWNVGITNIVPYDLNGDGVEELLFSCGRELHIACCDPETGALSTVVQQIGQAPYSLDVNGRWSILTSDDGAKYVKTNVGGETGLGEYHYVFMENGTLSEIVKVCDSKGMGAEIRFVSAALDGVPLSEAEADERLSFSDGAAVMQCDVTAEKYRFDTVKKAFLDYAALAGVTDGENLLESCTSPQHEQFVTLSYGGEKYIKKLHLYEWNASGYCWEEAFSCRAYIGKNGLNPEKREGDGTTPGGLFEICFAFSGEPLSGGIEFLQVKKGNVWVDDANSKYYNQLVDGSIPVSWNSCENVYEQCQNELHGAIVFDFNGNGRSADGVTRGDGSCTYISGRNMPRTDGTTGDIELFSDDFDTLLSCLKAEKNPVLFTGE